MNLLSRWNQSFSNLSVRRKLNLLTALIAVGVIALAIIAARMQYLDLAETRKEALKTQVELSYGILAHYTRLASSGELTEEAAKAAAPFVHAKLAAVDANVNLGGISINISPDDAEL